MSFKLGVLVHCSVEIQAYVNGVLTYVDPTDVYFQFKAPGVPTVEYHYGADAQLVKDDVGKYYVDLDITISGKWYIRYYSTGTYQSADEAYFDIDKLNV